MLSGGRDLAATGRYTAEGAAAPDSHVTHPHASVAATIRTGDAVSPRRRPALALAIGLQTLALGSGWAAEPAPRASIAMHGEPALPDGFRALPYVNPDAPQGGTVSFATLESFDNTNPFNVQGAAAAGVSNLVFETLMRRSLDEPFSFYPLIARSVETPDDRSWVEFRLDPAAHFSDGEPITAADVAFSWRLLRDNRPAVRLSYSKVARVEVKDAHTIRFWFAPARDGSIDRELPLILCMMTILPEHATDVAGFGKPTLKPLVGSGPYTFGQIKPGESVSFRKDPRWWGRGLASNRGLYNPDTVVYQYYRDANAMFEAFKTGLYTVRVETDAGRWADQYGFPAVASGKVVRQELASHAPQGMSAFVFNTRRPVFADPHVREALASLFDFEWVDRNLYSGLYARTCSFFEGTDLSSCGRPADPEERRLLAPYPAAVRPDVMAGTWQPTVTDGSGRDRPVARRAVALLRQAGWTFRDGAVREERTGRPLAFEIMVTSREQERLALAYAGNLRLIGVPVQVRLVDNVQFQKRRIAFDFDMVPWTYTGSLSPGNEQSQRWQSAAADVQGSFNFAGVREPAVDAMIAALLAARSEADFTSAVRALDRVLISGAYVVPLFHSPNVWLAHWRSVGVPERAALTGLVPDSFWQVQP